MQLHVFCLQFYIIYGFNSFILYNLWMISFQSIIIFTLCLNEIKRFYVCYSIIGNSQLTFPKWFHYSVWICWEEKMSWLMIEELLALLISSNAARMGYRFSSPSTPIQLSLNQLFSFSSPKRKLLITFALIVWHKDEID